MKKALLSVSLIAMGVMMAAAQSVTITSGTNGNGGQIIIGQQAQANAQVGGSLINLIQLVQNIVTRLVPLGIGLAVVALFFGIVMFLVSARNDEGGKKKQQWLSWMGYSILGLFVMVAIWGLVGFLSSVLGIGVGGSAPTPGIPYAQ